ncbi:MAG: fumarylacetoacetate hydrolase family protein [Candidatus Thermoplasmatota archaeon]|nr:fumarylacetoacetate hydrolase family protein [Candidatus Thermoplasmatota archaeon]
MSRVRFKDPAGSIRIGELKDGMIEFGNRTYRFEDIDILPPTRPTKLVCIGLNYQDHAEETGRDIPDRPKLFLKPPNTLAGHGDTIQLLKDKERIDHEAELGVVIDRQCKSVSKENAMDFVMGFTCVNDLSNRDDQRQEQNWVRGKAFDNAAPVGPVIVDSDKVPKDAEIKAEVNGEIKQKSSIDELVFSIPELIEEISSYLTLERGDIISTGTPSGVGPIEDGDKVTISIEGIGSLVNHFKK